ncbi:hypothetical protein AK812_SmicGene28047 [Symbiodinium microadriaticum]|uniref:Uncharacterized protein n=2 Tax=Symbiodinium TaxID=2949 RepID=A0A1Q9D5B6_SYMMI|nr:hypothetical protein AK812_SmicGene28047 [Symbiodinium microadriaticum]
MDEELDMAVQRHHPKKLRRGPDEEAVPPCRAEPFASGWEGLCALKGQSVGVRVAYRRRIARRLSKGKGMWEDRCPMYNTPTLSTASCSPQQRLSDVQNMAGISPRKRYGASEKREPVEVSFGVGTRPNNGVTLVEPTAYRRAQVGARSEASETSQSPQRQWQVEPLTANSTKARPWRQQVQEKPATLGDDSIAATSGSARDSLRGLAAERDRLQRQVQEMRSDVSNTRQDLSSQHARQKVQTEELPPGKRGTLQDLQAEAQRLQTEQRRQAAALKGSLKAPDPSANMRLEKQVEGVVSIVKGQEERFERLETDITSAYESQRKQLQQALAENRQLAKGLEEDSMRRQNMMAELMEKVTRNSAVNQLSSELANASTVIQGQTADWSVLSRQIRQEVTGLASEMKADRESRALECASNRVEVVKMVEDARRQGAMEAMGLHDQGGVPDLYLPAGAEAMISRPGILAVHNLVDINCKILRDMEDQLVIRAGFIAGVFHTWRFQANLLKTGRQFEEHFHDIQDQWSAELHAHRRTFEDQLAAAADKAAAHKEHVRQQHDLLLRQWMLGDAKGMYTSIWRAWSGYVVKEKTRLRNAANIKKACLQWCEGKNKGLKHSVFSSWQQEYSLAHLKRLRDQDLDEAQAEFDAAMKARLDELEHHRQGAKKALEKAVAKWKDGEQKGMVNICFRALKENRATARARKAKHKSVEMALKKFLLGKDRGAKLTLWSSWKQDMLESRLRAGAQSKLQDQLDAQSARLKAEFEVTSITALMAISDLKGGEYKELYGEEHGSGIVKLVQPRDPKCRTQMVGVASVVLAMLGAAQLVKHIPGPVKMVLSAFFTTASLVALMLLLTLSRTLKRICTLPHLHGSPLQGLHKYTYPALTPIETYRLGWTLTHPHYWDAEAVLFSVMTLLIVVYPTCAVEALRFVAMSELPSFVVEHYLRLGGCETNDPEVLQIAADATEAFVKRILKEARDISKSRMARAAASDAAPNAPDSTGEPSKKRQRTASEEPPQAGIESEESVLRLHDLLEALRRF